MSQPNPKSLDKVIKLAIMAVGGQGGGVLTSWIESVARNNGYVAQATSVAGVSQRTGATIYYIEMAPESDQTPVFSLVPSAGDVDIMIASELMEVGRSILRQFVTPERTTLIGSTHRMLAVSEKMTPGDGIANADKVIAAAKRASAHLVLFDMEQLATSNGSVISSSLLGALAGSGALPFPRDAYEQAIKDSKKGVEASLRAFSAGFDAATGALSSASTPTPTALSLAWADGAGEAHKSDWQTLGQEVKKLPESAQAMAWHGLYKVVDFQDLAYGREYLDKLLDIARQDDPAKGHLLTREAAKYLAQAMAYDDVIRVADLKTRAGRTQRIRREMNVADQHLLQTTEFMHPRAEEITSLLPVGLGQWLEKQPWWMNGLSRLFRKGKRYRSDGLRAFVTLYLLGGLRGRYRLKTLRHAVEKAHCERWLNIALSLKASNYDLAVEVLRCRRLIKGYSDTHERGLSKFDQVMGAVASLAIRADGAHWLRQLREAALKDEKGEAMQSVLVQSQTTAPEKKTPQVEVAAAAVNA